MNIGDTLKTHTIESQNRDLCLLYDCQFAGVEDKFVNSILHNNNHKRSLDAVHTCAIFQQWEKQTNFKFGFIPCSEQELPVVTDRTSPVGLSFFNAHALVRATGRPNYMQARIPVQSQLNVEAWKYHLQDYWDHQLLQLIEFGFPLDFNRKCPLKSEGGNHSSASEFPEDIEVYLAEERKYNAILGPFETNHIPNCQDSPFMTRHKANSHHRRVIIDLSWPLGESVNAGIDKHTYLGSDFELAFPLIDDITNELKRLGRGALLYKVDVSRAFRHVKIDPGDYNLLGLQWNGTYVDTYLPFGTRHGSQIFQWHSDAVSYVMRKRGFSMINYFDDYVGVGVPSVGFKCFDYLTSLMRELGPTISEKKLVPPVPR